MHFHNLKAVALTLILIGAIATGAGLLKQSLARKGETNGRPLGQPTPAAKSDGPIQRPAPGRMFVTGRVLDPQGKPVADAVTMVYARFKEPGRGINLGHMNAAPFGQGHGDRSGRFRIDAPRTSSARNDLFGVVALAPGYRAGWADLDPDTEHPTADVTLRPEQIIQGRLFDLEGQPARNVKVTVGSNCNRSVARWFNGASLVDCDFTPMPLLPVKSSPRAPAGKSTSNSGAELPYKDRSSGRMESAFRTRQ